MLCRKKSQREKQSFLLLCMEGKKRKQKNIVVVFFLQTVKRKEKQCLGTQRQLVRAHCWKKKDEKTKKKNEKFLLQREERLNPQGFFFHCIYQQTMLCSQKTKKSWKTSIVFCVFRAKPNKSQKMVTKSRNFIGKKAPSMLPDAVKMSKLLCCAVGQTLSIFQTTLVLASLSIFTQNIPSDKKMVLLFCLSRHFSWEIDKLKHFTYLMDIWNFSIKIPQSPLNDITTRVFCFALKKTQFSRKFG